jgi:hypothetical protein
MGKTRRGEPRMHMAMLIIKNNIDRELNISAASVSLSRIILETSHSSKRYETVLQKNPAARSSLPGQIIGGRVHNDRL